MYSIGFVYNAMPNVIYVTKRERYLNKKEVMNHVTVNSYPTINKFLKAGEIYAIDTPMGKRFKESEIDEYMDSLPKSYAK